MVWDTRCDVYDFRTRTSFEVRVLVEDMDECSFSDPDLMVFQLSVMLPGNADPVIGTDLPDNELQNGITRKVFESVDFNVFGDDADNNALELRLVGNAFDPAAYAMEFPLATGTGHVSAPFNWELLCEKLDLTHRDTFDLMFIVVDESNKCRLYQADTLNVRIRATPPDNTKPLLTIA